VPDGAIAEIEGRIAPGPWVAHVSGATSLSALAPHTKRFSVHPLQTFRRGGDPTQFDDAWGAVTAESAGARDRATWLATRLGLRPFDLADDQRVLYHAGAAVASNYLVTLFRAAASMVEKAGVPKEALVPLMRRTIENGFDLTGPIARGDWAVVERHIEVLASRAPEWAPMYRALANVTKP
jgi:predicted short-subunit dehydrogenase-like oxidoreductase (DUF2520 family)